MNWFEKLLEDSGMSIPQAAEQVNLSVDQVRTLKTGKKRLLQDKQYQRLGEVFQRDWNELKAMHQAEIAAYRAEQQKRPAASTDGAQGTTKPTRPVDRADSYVPFLTNALELCDTRLGYESLGVATRTIADCLSDKANVLTRLSEAVLSPLEELINHASTQKRLDDLRFLLGNIAMAAVLPRKAWEVTDGAQATKKGWELRVASRGNAFAMRMTIERHNSQSVHKYNVRQAMRFFKAENSDQLTTALHCAIEFPETKQEDVIGRVHEIVTNIVTTANLQSKLGADCPDLDDATQHQAFKDYCKGVDRQLEMSKATPEHVFCFSMKNESRETRAELFEFLPSLRLFLCDSDPAALPLLTVDEDDLEAWFATVLTKIQNKEEQLLRRQAPAEKASSDLPDRDRPPAEPRGETPSTAQEITPGKKFEQRLNMVDKVTGWFLKIVDIVVKTS